VDTVVQQWSSILSRFPSLLQDEIRDERSGSQEDCAELEEWKLLYPTPVSLKLTRGLISRHAWLISMTIPKVRNRINDRFGLNILAWRVYDKDPERSLRYSKLPADGARPSVMVDGEVYWGCGRFLAAILRNDVTLKVWDIESRALYGSTLSH